ncbi:MAG: ABC transporter substrate-binding protein [Anaerolineae bacterium]|nr:ABC transporter substrate-binding protein [Anaerolineae bacterium]
MVKKLSRRDFIKTTGAAAAGASIGFSALSSRTPRTFAAPRRQDQPRLAYLIRAQSQPDTQLVQDALSDYMSERIGATIELRFIEPGAFDDQMALINAAAEEYDLVYTAPWTNNYYTNVNQEYLFPLDDMLLELAPGLWSSMTPETWEAARVQGEIYGSINQQIFVKPFGPFIRDDVLDTLELRDAFASVTSYAEMTPLFAQIKEYIDQDDVLTHIASGAGIAIQDLWGYDPQDAGLVIKSTDETAQAQIFSETDEYRQAIELSREWYLAGYVPSDEVPADEADRAWSAGQYVMRLAGVVKPGGDAEALARWGIPVTSYPIAEPLLTTGGVTATLTGVSSTSNNPELAVKYLELVNTDPVFYNMLCKGIEGTHWEWADQERLLIQPAGGAASFTDVGWNPNVDWMFGNVFNSYYSSEAQVGAWPETAELNRTARPSPVLGFTFNRAPVETEIASVTAVGDEFGKPLNLGFVDPTEGIARLNEELKNAGIERVQEEMQRQIDEWKAANA